MWGRVLVIMRKELLQVLREPKARAMLIGPPLVQLLVFGYVVNLDIIESRYGWWDQDKSPESRQLLSMFQGARQFQLFAEVSSGAEAADLLDRGLVDSVVRVPPSFSADLHRQSPASIQILLDGSDSNTASIVGNYFSRIVARFQRETLARQMEARLVGAPDPPAIPARSPVELESRVWFNPDLRSQDFFIPGVVVNIIGLVTVMLTAMAVVREKEIGTMEQLMVTPIQPLELMLGKTLPFALIGLAEVFLVTGAAVAVFGIPLRGSISLLVVGSLLFLLSTLGAGLLISTFSGTQQQALMGSFFFFLPTFMLSGFVFPIRNMPEVVQYLTYFNSVRYFTEIVRGIFLKGVGLSVLWPQMAALLAIGVAMIVFSTLLFHKDLE